MKKMRRSQCAVEGSPQKGGHGYQAGTWSKRAISHTKSKGRKFQAERMAQEETLKSQREGWSGWNGVIKEERRVGRAGRTQITVRAQFSSVQSLKSCPTLCDPWITARQASLSITISQSSLRLTSIESVMPSSHFTLCRPLLLLPPTPPSMSLFQWVNSSHEVAKVLEFQLQHHSLQRNPRTDLLQKTSQSIKKISDPNATGRC